MSNRYQYLKELLKKKLVYLPDDAKLQQELLKFGNTRERHTDQFCLSKRVSMHSTETLSSIRIATTVRLRFRYAGSQMSFKEQLEKYHAVREDLIEFYKYTSWAIAGSYPYDVLAKKVEDLIKTVETVKGISNLDTSNKAIEEVLKNLESYAREIARRAKWNKTFVMGRPPHSRSDSDWLAETHKLTFNIDLAIISAITFVKQSDKTQDPTYKDEVNYDLYLKPAKELRDLAEEVWSVYHDASIELAKLLKKFEPACEKFYEAAKTAGATIPKAKITRNKNMLKTVIESDLIHEFSYDKTPFEEYVSTLQSTMTTVVKQLKGDKQALANLQKSAPDLFDLVKDASALRTKTRKDTNEYFERLSNLVISGRELEFERLNGVSNYATSLKDAKTQAAKNIPGHGSMSAERLKFFVSATIEIEETLLEAIKAQEKNK